MKRVKLFDLSDKVQAVAVKNTADGDKPSIDFNIHTEAAGAWVSFSWTAKYKDDETRDGAFDNLIEAGIIAVFNEVVTQNDLPLDTIELNVNDIEVNNPSTV